MLHRAKRAVDVKLAHVSLDMHSWYRPSGKPTKNIFPYFGKDTTVNPTWWTGRNRHDESRHNDVVLASRTFRLINKSHMAGDIKVCPWLIQLRVTMRRQDADIRRWCRSNRPLMLSKSARRTHWILWYVSPHWLSNKAVFLLRNACLFLTVLFLASFSGDLLIHRTWTLGLKSYWIFAYWPTGTQQKSKANLIAKQHCKFSTGQLCFLIEHV